MESHFLTFCSPPARREINQAAHTLGAAEGVRAPRALTRAHGAPARGPLVRFSCFACL